MGTEVASMLPVDAYKWSILRRMIQGVGADSIVQSEIGQHSVTQECLHMHVYPS